jgi:hypothetical protein
MAEPTRNRSRNSRSDQDGRPPQDEEEQRDESRSENDRPGGRLSAKELTEAAATTIADLTGFDPESVAGLQWDGESWLVTVDVVEVARVPNTTDLLGSYVVQLDDGGGLLGYKRTRRFVRGQVDEQ